MSDIPRFYQVEREDSIVIWKFVNPPRNLITIETNAELVGLVEAFDRDPALRVAIYTSGVPGQFVQHFDVASILSRAEAMGQVSDEAVAQQMAQMPPPMGLGERTGKPLICAINGPVEGGGCEMALACDFRFISQEAYMGQPEVNAGFLPGGGGTQRLTRMLGVSKAMELCLTGRRIYPDEAERLGLVVKACDPFDLMPTVMSFARALATKPPVGMAKIKQAIYQGVGLPLREGLLLERKLFFEAIRSEEALRLMRAYVAVGQDRQKLADLMASQQA